MKRSFYKTPVPYLVIDNFFDEDTLNDIYAEIKQLKDRYHQGVIRRDGVEQVDKSYKLNTNIWLDVEFEGRRNDSSILKGLRKCWFNNENMEFLREHNNPFFGFVTESNDDRTLLSRYVDGDFYTWHQDAIGDPIIYTLNIFLSENQMFTGGDFTLERNGVSKTIEFKTNRAVLFPSRTKHNVSKVELYDGVYEHGRFTIQNWASIHK